MKLNEFVNTPIPEDMPMGRNEVIFDHIDYRLDKETGDINGIFVHIKDYNPLFLPFFDNGQNYQLNLLLKQLGVKSYNPDDINEATGTVIVAHRYIRTTEEAEYTNVSFNANRSEEEATFA